jgi:DNA-binding NtrC family response regulator
MIDRNLTSEGYSVFTVMSVSEAMTFLKSHPIDLVITDLKMPKVSGLELVKYIRENLKETEVMMITGYATIDGAVQAVKTGAEEYLTKPFTDEELFAAVERTLKKLSIRKASISKPIKNPFLSYGILGDSLAMQKVYSAVQKVALSSANVLITGESGTGKELIARAIHYSSSRVSSPFIPVNCGGIPETLLESELFGYVKGAFTGALETRAGFFQTADGGTIFLDEISETSLAMQVKLLRVLEDKVICMVGNTRPIKLDVRIIAATNKDLGSLVKKNTFREDLFFRVNVINIPLPPLRDRGDDILLLVNHFANKFANEAEKPLPTFSDDALAILRNYNWPGNVRELENVIQRIVVLSDDHVINVADMPELLRFTQLGSEQFTGTLAEVEKVYIQKVLANVKNNKTKAAEILGIDRKTLRKKLKI